METNKIYCGDALQVLAKFAAGSIDCCFTSPDPPFERMMEKGKNVVGSESNTIEYLKHLIDIFEEVKRVLKNEGSLWVQMGDYHQEGTMRLIPEAFAIAMVRKGWYLKSKLIWHHPNKKVQQEETDRFMRDWEYLFFFTKSINHYFNNKDNHFNKTSVYQIPYVIPPNNQFESGFPEDLIKVAIKTTVPSSGIVLDPFACTGITGIVAKRLGRQFVLIDIDKGLCEMMEIRLST